MRALDTLRMMMKMMQMRVRGIRMVQCKEALEKVFEYLDGELDEADAAAVGAHFELCRACYPRYRFEESFLDSLRGIQQDEKAPPALRDRILHLLDGEE